MLELFVSSFGYRYSDPMTTFIGLSKDAVEDAIDSAMQWERQEMPRYCDGHDDEDDEESCQLCNPDLVWFGAWPVYHVKDLGGLRATINYIKDARDNPNGVTTMEGI